MQGDRTSHGGTVVEASQVTFTHDKPIARVGDKVTCPIPGHGTTVIVEGDPTMILDGKPVARHGDKCACGAVLISSQVVSTTDDGGTSNPQAASQAQKDNAAAHGIAPQTEPVKFEWDEQVKLVVSNGTAVMVGLPWFVRTSDGRTYSGRLDEAGQFPRIESLDESDYEIHWGDDAIAAQREAQQ